MRVLCINYEKPIPKSWAELFLKLSPRIHFRPPGYIFVEISTTAHLFGGEDSVLQKAKEISEDQATLAIASTPYWAQALASFESLTIAPLKTYELEEVTNPFPLSVLLNLEGLSPWESEFSKLQQIISFLESLGFLYLQNLWSLSCDDFAARWGQLGIKLYRRLHQLEEQLVSPLLETEAFVGYAYFDFPAENISVITPFLQKEISLLCLRAEARGRFFKRLFITLHCEYSQLTHGVEISPIKASRDPKVFLDILIRKLELLCFENPIRQFEISCIDIPEKLEQLDFLEARDDSEENWAKLLNRLHILPHCEKGFYSIPSHSWPGCVPQLNIEKPLHSDSSLWNLAPRPSLFLKQPRPLNEWDKAQLKKLSRYPLERIEHSWWHSSDQRDYYMAQHSNGSLWWIYEDLNTHESYLHGYFD